MYVDIQNFLKNYIFLELFYWSEYDLTFKIS